MKKLLSLFGLMIVLALVSTSCGGRKEACPTGFGKVENSNPQHS
ncbi:MAG: hypothetical protein R3A43_10635 [Bacteroidia bacterium]